MDLSIVVVNWNTQVLLKQCLESIGHTIHTVVIDNASTDGSITMVRERFPWVVLIENEKNVGFARANNQGIQVSTSRYILLLNSDTVVPSGTLQALTAFADSHPSAGIVGVRLINPDGSFQAGPNRFPTLLSVLLETWGVTQWLARNPYYPSHTPERSEASQMCDWVGGACILARRSAIAQVGMLDDNFFMNSEEVDWCYRMVQSGWEVWYLPVSVIHHGGASARRSTAVQRLRNYRGKVLFLRKHRSVVAGRLAQINFRLASLFKAMLYRIFFLIRRDIGYREQALSHWTVTKETSWPRRS